MDSCPTQRSGGRPCPQGSQPLQKDSISNKAKADEAWLVCIGLHFLLADKSRRGLGPEQSFGVL